MDRWLQKVNDEIPESDSHKNYSIKNNLPELISDLCKLLESGDFKAGLHSSKDHGEKRSDFDNYSLMHLIREYRILKQVIFDLLDEKTVLQIEERNAIMFIIDRAIEQAGEAFFNIRQDEKEEARQKAEKIVQNLQEEGVLRDNFFSGVTHDLKNPINNIKMAVEFMENYKVKQESQAKLLEAIRTSAHRAEALIRDLLDINLIKSGNKLPLNPEVSDLLELTRQSVNGFKTETRQRIGVDAQCFKCKGYWDSSLIIRAVDNLLQNAIKYGDEDAPIDILISKGPIYASVAVHNEGQPIPEEKRASLFNRFYRADEDHASGWGLGLALVQGIVEAHGGKIDLMSEEGSGTTFTLQIPHGSISPSGEEEELQNTKV